MKTKILLNKGVCILHKDRQHFETIAEELETGVDKILPIYWKIEELGTDCKPGSVFEAIKIE